MNYFVRLVNYVQHQLPGRLANTIIYLSNQVQSENPFCLDLTKEVLASIIGASRESVFRLLKSFRESEIINMDKKKITILDFKRLEEVKQKG